MKKEKIDGVRKERRKKKQANDKRKKGSRK